MSLSLFFDTETTGLLPTDRIVSIACLIYDMNAISSDEILDEFYEIIKPEGFSIISWHTSTKIHKITQQVADKKGVSIKKAISFLDDHLPTVGQIVGHNVDFDIRILLNELKLAGRFDLIELVNKIPTRCTMKENTVDGVRPKLTTLYKSRIGKDFDAHNAYADITATAQCYFWKAK